MAWILQSEINSHVASLKLNGPDRWYKDWSAPGKNHPQRWGQTRGRDSVTFWGGIIRGEMVGPMVNSRFCLKITILTNTHFLEAKFEPLLKKPRKIFFLDINDFIMGSRQVNIWIKLFSKRHSLDKVAGWLVGLFVRA